MTLTIPQLEKITPAKAEGYLNVNKANRKLREGVAERYAHDMKTGNWTECPVPISFFEDGDVADGQHRLWAIVESGVTIQFLVLRGLPREAGLNIDTGLGRSVVDNARISGLDDGLSNILVAMAGFYELGAPKRGLTNSDRVAIIDRYRDVLDWAVANGPTGKGIRNTPILCAVARARAHGVDEERLKAFCVVLSKGLSNGSEDAAAISLRNYVMARDRRLAHQEGRDLFMKTMNAIHYFLRRRSLNIIKTVSEEMFPLKKARS